MTTILVLPLKSLQAGKTRLMPVMSGDERAALIEALLGRTVDQATLFPGLPNTVLISPCAQVRRMATALGLRALEEPGEGLNAALDHARRFVCTTGASRMMIIPCDLPDVQAADLRALHDAAPPGAVAIAPDRQGIGTNGLCLAPSLPFPFQFGPGSFARHLDAGERSGLRTVAVHRAGLAFDVDTPGDLSAMRSAQGPVAVD